MIMPATSGSNFIRLGVFCGSRKGSSVQILEAAHDLGTVLAAAGVALVYGGGGSGLMGVIAKAVRGAGGRVYGVIPASLLVTEEAQENLAECVIVDNFHERKAMITSLSDGIVAFPGGPGTLEELAEQLALNAACVRQKPVYVFNIQGFWNPLIARFAEISQGAGERRRSDLPVIVSSAQEIVELLRERYPGRARPTSQGTFPAVNVGDAASSVAEGEM